MTWSRQFTRPLVVFAASDDEDTVAVGIIGEAITQLKQAVEAVVRQLGLGGQQIPLALAGGVLIHQPAFGRQLCDSLAAGGFNYGPTSTVHHPVAGALRLAGRVPE